MESCDKMEKLIELESNKYEEYVKNHKYKSHFLQSYYWGEFSKSKKNLTPYYLGLVDEKNNILGACLLLQKKLPLGYSYMYSPRGFVIDYNDSKLMSIMTKNVVEFSKKKKAIFVKIDPDIIKEKHNYNDELIPLSYDINKIFNDLKKAGFKHLGFTKNFETMQPRYSFRIDMNQSLEEIESHFSKTTKQRINKAIKIGTDVEIGTIDDIDEFYHLMTLTENRKDFVSYKKDYYEKLFEIFDKQGMVKLFLGKINTNKIINNLNNNLDEIKNKINEFDTENLSKSSKNKLNELNKNKENLEKEIKKYSEAKSEYGDIITINAHMIIFYGDKAWVLYAGNHNILTESYANYNTYYEHIKYSYEHGVKIYDQFGTIGDLRKDNPRIGLHEFKKKFGGDYVEFLGEFDYIINRPMYIVFTKLVPLYRKIIKNKGKKELKQETNLG